MAHINPRWLSLRHRLVDLRHKLYQFRFSYTVAAKKQSYMSPFLKRCDESKRSVDGSVNYFSERGILEARREVERYYAQARDDHNECLILAESLFMGVSGFFEPVYSTGGPFCETHAYPRDGIALGYLRQPHCLTCSEREGKRETHPNFRLPGILVFEDTCPYCEKSFLELLRLGYVYVAREDTAVHDPIKQSINLLALASKIQRAEELLACIFMPT